MSIPSNLNRSDNVPADNSSTNQTPPKDIKKLLFSVPNKLLFGVEEGLSSSKAKFSPVGAAKIGVVAGAVVGVAIIASPVIATAVAGGVFAGFLGLSFKSGEKIGQLSNAVAKKISNAMGKVFDKAVTKRNEQKFIKEFKTAEKKFDKEFKAAQKDDLKVSKTYRKPAHKAASVAMTFPKAFEGMVEKYNLLNSYEGGIEDLASQYLNESELKEFKVLNEPIKTSTNPKQQVGGNLFKDYAFLLVPTGSKKVEKNLGRDKLAKLNAFMDKIQMRQTAAAQLSEIVGKLNDIRPTHKENVNQWIKPLIDSGFAKVETKKDEVVAVAKDEVVAKELVLNPDKQKNLTYKDCQTIEKIHDKLFPKSMNDQPSDNKGDLSIDSN